MAVENQGDAGQGAAWSDAFPDVKADAALTTALAQFKTPVDAFRAATAPKPDGFGEKWREAIADDDKELAMLQRFPTPKEFKKSWREGKTRIDASDLLKPLAEKPTEQEIVEYRKAHGIPEKAEGYLDKLPEGLVLGAEDRPIFEGFAKALHEVNADPRIAHAAIKWYNGFAEEQEGKFVEDDKKAEGTARTALRDKWGQDYRPNLNIMKSFLDALPEGVSKMLVGGRGPDGNLLINTPEFSEWVVAHAREINPTITLFSGDGGAPGKALETEIAEIEKFMRTNRADYNRDVGKQTRLRELYEARIRLAEQKQGRAA